ncbi:MAG: hypothetical protein HY659_06875 [Rhizobiales bacterium]|nr:hypothetical protein [Hyphomicrobiales bacterium]
MFPQVPELTPEDVLASHVLIASEHRVLDADAECTLVTWRRARPSSR